MSRYFSYLNSARQILSEYHGEEPFSSFLKKYFRQHPRFGSKDRRQVSQLCYGFFRLGKAWPGMPVEERIIAGLLLSTKEPTEILNTVKPQWMPFVTATIEEKLSVIRPTDPAPEIFPWKHDLSEGIVYEKFNESFFTQPDLFLRLRPGRENKVTNKLDNAGIKYDSPIEGCLALPITTKIEDLIALNHDAVIQDLSSQQTGKLLESIKDEIHDVWDCCAASGGKSIMAIDVLGKINLTVSDIRESILHNLRKRFREAGIRNYRQFVADLSQSRPDELTQTFDLVIADVPCTGSGTWGRTPEQLYYFQIEEVKRYAALQRKIVENAWHALKPGAYLLYITCSVFRKENEENIEYFCKNFPAELMRLEVLKGYERKADTLFAALLKKTS